MKTIQSIKPKLKLFIVLGLFIILLIFIIFANQISRKNLDLRDKASENQENELILMTFNLRVSHPTQNPNYPNYINGLADYIINNKIDIIGFQEFPFDRDGKPLNEFLLPKLEEKNYPMHSIVKERKNLEIDGITLSNAIFSKYPILDHKNYVFDSPYGGEQHVIQTAKIALDSGNNIWVINHHPHPVPACNREHEYFNQFKNVVTEYKDEITFILGDYNFTKDRYCYSELSNLYTDACTQSNNKTCEVTVGDPNSDGYAIDYIFHNTNFQVIELRTDYNQKISDHYPVIGNFSISSITTTPTDTITQNPITSKIPTSTSSPTSSTNPTSSVNPTSSTSLTRTSSPTTTVIGEPCGPIDTNSNFEVDISDFESFKKIYGKNCTDTIQIGGCGSKDSDANGLIDIIDFQNFINLYKHGCD